MSEVALNKESETKAKGSATGLIIFVSLLFLLLITAWTGLILVARDHQPQVIEVERPTQP